MWMMYVRYKYLTRIYLVTVAVLHNMYTLVYGTVQPLYNCTTVPSVSVWRYRVKSEIWSATDDSWYCLTCELRSYYLRVSIKSI